MIVNRFKRLLGSVPETRENLTIEKGILTSQYQAHQRLLITTPVTLQREIRYELDYTERRIEAIDKQLAEMAQKGGK